MVKAALSCFTVQNDICRYNSFDTRFKPTAYGWNKNAGIKIQIEIKRRTLSTVNMLQDMGFL